MSYLYRYDMRAADRAGFVSTHPTRIIRFIAPDAYALECCAVAEAWLFSTNTPIDNPPSYIQRVDSRRRPDLGAVESTVGSKDK